MSTLLQVKGKNNRILKNVSKGCDLDCGGIGDLVTCPSFERFQFHMPCLQKLLYDLGKQGVEIIKTQILLINFITNLSTCKSHILFILNGL